MQPTPPPTNPIDTPPLLTAAGFRTLWDPELSRDAIVLTDERLCILRTGLPIARLAQVVDDIWTGFWNKYGNAAIDLLVAEILTGQRPDCPHTAPVRADQPGPGLQ